MSYTGREGLGGYLGDDDMNNQSISTGSILLVNITSNTFYVKLEYHRVVFFNCYMNEHREYVITKAWNGRLSGQTCW